METTNKLVEVYAESTPNPAAMKFVVNKMLLANGVVEYSNKEEAKICPLAYQLFDFTGVKSVFITSNFITITKENDIDWYDILAILREFIKGFFMNDEKLFLENPFEKSIDNGQGTIDKTENFVAGTNSEIEEQIKNMLDEYVRPAVEQDGGAIHFKSFHEGTLTLVLKGSCSGCPSSTVTLKSGIENLLKKMVPQVLEVVAEEG